MDEHKERLRLYIERSIHDVCPYEDKDLQIAYHTGFLQGFLVRLILKDSKNLDLFKKVIEERKNGSKE